MLFCELDMQNLIKLIKLNVDIKVASTEKTKHRMDTELEDLQLEFERVNAAAIVADKRAQNFDKVRLGRRRRR